MGAALSESMNAGFSCVGEAATCGVTAGADSVGGVGATSCFSCAAIDGWAVTEGRSCLDFGLATLRLGGVGAFIQFILLAL